MYTLSTFKESIKQSTPDVNLSPLLKSLWYDAKGEWNKAHDQVDHLNDQDSAWVHAYLHRKEGDIWNADYWYARAKKTRPNITVEEEWEHLVEEFI